MHILLTDIGRLAALPCFLKSHEFWQGAMDPRLSIDTGAKFGHLREFSSTHVWGIERYTDRQSSKPVGDELSVIELGLGILQRGAWSPCSWGLETALANKFQSAGLGEIAPFPKAAGLLGFDAKPHNAGLLAHALIPGRLQAEADLQAVDDMWESANRDIDMSGSAQERQFFKEVLAPTLGFPLLDFLRFQTSLKELGIDPAAFARQRTDFSIDTGRGLRLVIEVDGRQHEVLQTQLHLDRVRDRALKNSGWQVWRVPVKDLDAPDVLVSHLQSLLKQTPGGTWGTKFGLSASRTPEVFNIVWGATAVARTQFLILTAMQNGLLPFDRPWVVRIEENETSVAAEALSDFLDWFGRLRALYSLPDLSEVRLALTDEETADLSVFISCTNPHAEPVVRSTGVHTWSRPANFAALEPSLTFSERQHFKRMPERDLLESFAQDLFRKSELREGQYEILSRILLGRDVVGLLPTGGGKSLTYQLASLLLPGATIYVAPLKSLLQDQYERMKVDGIDACGFISSALNTQERRTQEARFAAGRMRMLQVAPERFLMETFRSLLNDYQSKFGSVCQVVVDECHCVSEWGHDFRPAYLSLSRIIKDRTNRLGSSAPVVALTGTASSIVLDDVRRELGIQDSAAVVRAKRMDRPELELTFELTTSAKKRGALVERTADFLARHGGTQGGLLVFTQHVNGSFGVYDLGSEIVNRLSLDFGRDVRIYSGEAPKAISSTMSSADWDREKAQAQRAFISPRGDSFQILVATSAFGMGIDKPSIREVIHYLSPQSPESYYQEVGRAARDREPAKAVLLFSDEASELTDEILSPETDITTAREVHASIKRGKPVGDFLTTFFFHASRFTGVANEVLQAVKALEAIKQLLDSGDSIVLSYLPSRAATSWNAQGPLEYSLVRLIHLGVVLDYTKDFNAKTIEVTASPLWLAARKDLETCREQFVESFEAYVRQYETRPTLSLVQAMMAAGTVLEVEEEAIKAVVTYLYSQIERRRRTSTRTMLELARAGVTDVAEARKRLLFYLQASEKFTHELEQLARTDQSSLAWSQIVEAAKSPVEVDELRGAATRVLESYPTHPGLLLLSAILRRAPSTMDLERSKEEFQAALKLLVAIDSPDTAADAAEEALTRCTNIDAVLSRYLRTAYGAWSYAHYGARFALEHAGADQSTRMSVLNEMLATARLGIPKALF